MYWCMYNSTQQNTGCIHVVYSQCSHKGLNWFKGPFTYYVTQGRWGIFIFVAKCDKGGWAVFGV